MQSDIAQAVNALIKSGNEEGSPLTLPTFETIDIYPIFEHAFSEKAKTTLSKKTNTLIYQYNRPVPGASVVVMLGKLGLQSCDHFKDQSPKDIWFRDFDKVCFVGSLATRDKLPIAIEKVIKTINDVADKDFTKACLVQLSIVPFMKIDDREQEFAIVSYVTLTRQGEKYVADNMPDMFIAEGGIPMRVE